MDPKVSLRRLAQRSRLYVLLIIALASLDAAAFEDCSKKARPAWTEQERFVWERICDGLGADLDSRYGGNAIPAEAAEWPPKRRLRAKFLREILFDPSLSKEIPRFGVRLTGAHIPEKLNLETLALPISLVLVNSRIAELSLGDAELVLVSLNDSQIDRNLNGHRMRLRDSFMLRNGRIGADANLTFVNTGVNIDLRGTEVVGMVNLDSSTIGGSLRLLDAKMGSFSAALTSIGRNLMLSGANIGGKLEESAEPGELGKKDAPPNRVNLQSIRVGENLVARRVKFSKGIESVNLMDSQITGTLSLTETTLPSVNMSNAEIGRDLVFGNMNRDSAHWRKGAVLNLRNASISAIQDRCDPAKNDAARCEPDPWPADMELDGFTFRQFGSFEVDGRSKMALRSAEWWIDWLSRQKAYSPQPYKMVADVMREAGLKDKAEDIEYAAKDLERQNAKFPADAWLWTQKVLIGYGYRMWYVWFWIFGFLAAGILLLKVSREGKNNDLGWGVAYSIDMLLPIVKLRDKHYEIELKGWVRNYFYTHKIVGYVLAAFLGAGLSGLTK